MSLKDTDVRTPGDQAIAKKFKLSLAKVRALVKQGAEHEKEHNTNLAKAKEVARDHIGERPDYYKMLNKAEKTDKNIMKENTVGHVRGLGFVSGDPAAGVDYVDQYKGTNAMSYDDDNGDKLKYLQQAHIDHHNQALGHNFFNPTSIHSHSNNVFKANTALKEATTTDGGMGGDHSPKGEGDKYLENNVKNTDRDAKIRDDHAEENHHKHHMDLGFNAFRHNKIKDHINRALHEANGLALSKLNELGGSGEPDGYNGLTDPPPKLRSNDMKEENPCWKGYKQLGMKKKGAKKVPNCVSVEEDGPVMSRYTERPTYEGNDKYPDTAERGIYEGWASIGHAYDWAGDRNSKAKFYGKKPKPTTTKNDEKDDTYKDSKQGGKVKFAKTVKEEKKPKPVKLTPKQEQDKTIPSSMAYYREKIYQARLKQLRKEETQIDELKAETLGSYIKKASASRKAALTGPKADVATWGKRQKGITTAIKQLTKENSKDKDWDAATGFAEQVPSHLHLNKPDTKYAPGAAGITHTIHEETKMDNKPINEAIENIMEDNLGAMKENLMVALQEKAIEKLEERKKEIAAQYFAQ